jgi:hypothetical protein
MLDDRFRRGRLALVYIVGGTVGIALAGALLYALMVG